MGFDPLTLLTAALSVGGTAAGVIGAANAPKPPPLPASTPAGARAPGATVRVGTGQDEGSNTATNAPNKPGFTAERKVGKTFGGSLGRSGLAL